MMMLNWLEIRCIYLSYSGILSYKNHQTSIIASCLSSVLLTVVAIGIYHRYLYFRSFTLDFQFFENTAFIKTIYKLDTSLRRTV